MSKADRNRQQRAQEKIAQARALEAQRKRRRLTLTIAGAVVVVAAAGTGIALALSGSSGHKTAGGGSPHLHLAPLSTLGALRAAPPGPLGPESVPIPGSTLLAGTATKASGQVVDGIHCQTSEQTIFHVHAHLTVFVNGSPRQIPPGIGIPGAKAQSSPQGPFISSGTCFYWLHTHAGDGIIHIESPIQRTYTLGDFFDEWGQPLGPNQVGPVTGHVTALYNGQVYLGNPRDIPLNAHARIQLEVGTPLIAPVSINWPSGL
jgi:hypothetical protein